MSVFVQELDTLAFKADSSFSFIGVLKDGEKLIAVSGISRIENAFDLFPWIPKLHYLFLKYKGAFCESIKAAVYYKKDYEDPVDNDL